MHPDQDHPLNSPGAGGEAERAIAWVRDNGEQDELVAAVERRVRRRRRRRVAGLIVATSFALVAGFWALRTPDVGGPAEPARVATATISSPRQLVLPDGSRVELREDAVVSYDFDGPLRRVTLERGEAHFQVAKNPHRTFVVTAGGVEVRAVGTAFAVQATAGGVEVIVTEGRVAVDRNAPAVAAPAPAPAAVYVDVGQRVIVPPVQTEVAVVTLAREEMARRLGWRVPQLELSRTPVGEVLDLINRNATAMGKKRIVIDADSPELREIKLTGLLAADNSEGLVRMLQSSLKVEAEVAGDAIVVRKPSH